jgi:hypothetical protein
MMTSIFLFGLLSLPFAAMSKQDYSHLTALSTLYVALTVVQGVYTVVEGSYIPIFMRSVGWFPDRERFGDQLQDRIDAQSRGIWKEGFKVSVWGFFFSNMGALVALLIGVVIQYSRGASATIGYHSYLLAITTAGCLTSKRFLPWLTSQFIDQKLVVFAIWGMFLLPSIPEEEKPEGQSIFVLPVKGWIRLVRSATRYRQALKSYGIPDTPTTWV